MTAEGIAPEVNGPSLAWLSELLTACGLAVDLVVEPRPDDPLVPTFNYGELSLSPQSVMLDADGDQQASWRTALAESLRAVPWKVCLVNLLCVPLNSVRTELDGEPLADGAAMLAAALQDAPDGSSVVALAPAAPLLSLRTSAPLRAWIGRNHHVDWIIWLKADAEMSAGLPRGLRLAIMVVRKAQTPSEAATDQRQNITNRRANRPQLTRLVDLPSDLRPAWPGILKQAAGRGGGEVGSSNVASRLALSGEAWTYERFSTTFNVRQEDARQLGTLRPLSEFADIQAGIRRKIAKRHISEPDENGVLPRGSVYCYGGRSITPDGKMSRPAWGIPIEGLQTEQLLAEGDVLLRSIVGLLVPPAKIVGTRIEPWMLPATFDTSCLRVRWKPTVQPLVRELLTGYLTSTHARDWLRAHGTDLHLTVSALRSLEVPSPSQEVLDALTVLAEAEEQYRTWAADVEEVRRGLFASSSFAVEIPRLLAAQRVATERLTEARAAGGLAYRVRNHYPHPIALRREFIQHMEPGETKVRAALDCAEHLITLLAVIGTLQFGAEAAPADPGQSKLLTYVQRGALLLDWGKCYSALQEVVYSSARHPRPLTLNFPGLTELVEPMKDEHSDWSRAESQLRTWRNRQAHLQRLPEAELVLMSEEFVMLLDQMLETVSFLGTIPMLQAADYQRGLTGKRRATFHLLQGSNVAFQRAVRTVSVELARGAIGFLTREGEFVSAFPWLVMETCPVCRRPEVFVFNRFEKRVATYIAMETGHPRENSEFSTFFSDFIASRPLDGGRRMTTDAGACS